MPARVRDLDGLAEKISEPFGNYFATDDGLFTVMALIGELREWREIGREVLAHAEEEWEVDVEAFDGTARTRELLADLARAPQ